MNNIALIKKYPWLQLKNVWTNEIVDDELIWFDDLPEGWRKAFGLQMIEELDKILKKAKYSNKYQIAQVKEKWRNVMLVRQWCSR